MNTISRLRHLRILISTHEYATGPSHALEHYLIGKTDSLIFLAHPFVFSKDKRSHKRVYMKGKLSGAEVFFPLYIPIQILNIFKDIILTFLWSLDQKHVDLYVGADVFNACVGVLLQKIGRVEKTVFYTIDYIPKRFNNKILNHLYHALDAFAVKNVDYVWNLSSIMAEERMKVGLRGSEIQKKQLIVPVGTDTVIKPKQLLKSHRHHVAHMGHLTYKQGVQSLISAIPYILLQLPDFHLNIIGGGPMEQELREQAKKMRVMKYVTFYGFIADHNKVERFLAENAIGVAPYLDIEDNFVRYTDPGKVKAYLAAGLPIVITKVPAVWKTLVQKKAGVVVNSDDPKVLGQTIVEFLSDQEKLQIYRENAAALSKKYLWSTIFTKTFGSIYL